MTTETATEATTVGEYARFIDDDDAWGDLILEETVFLLDGEEVDEIDAEAVDPSAEVIIKDGVMVDAVTHKVHASLVTFFRRWRKRQEGQEFAIWVPSGVTRKQLEKHLAQLGAKLRTSNI